ncbi:MAG TPA: hypothetical protein DCR04_00815, partial [Flavobacteriales bacterium]|nr:hypothetical protein [Flavobacteriales bacterium]
FLHEGKWWPVKYAAWLYNMLPFLAIRLFNMRFENYVMLFMFLPFVDPSNFISVNETVGVIRKESLNDDFKKVINKCGIRVQRDIPVVNKTESKSVRSLVYDEDSIIINWAFGIELQRLGYGPNRLKGMVLFLNRIAYRISSVYKGTIWKLTRG